MSQGLTRKAIVAAAAELLDEVGIDAFSLRGVAKRLGIKAPSLYNHFTDKSDLLSELAKAMLAGAAIPDDDTSLDWRSYIVEVSVATRRSILERYRAAPLLLQFFPRQIMLAAYERAIVRQEAPLELAMVIVEGVEKLTLGSALFAAAARAQDKPPIADFDEARFPRLAAALDASPFDDEALFRETLRRFLAAFPDTG